MAITRDPAQSLKLPKLAELAVVKDSEEEDNNDSPVHHSRRGIPMMMREGWLLRTIALSFGKLKEQ